MYIIGKRRANGLVPTEFTFAQQPHVHTTFAAAMLESQRLARAEPGREFCIFILTSGAQVEFPPPPPVKVTAY